MWQLLDFYEPPFLHLYQGNNNMHSHYCSPGAKSRLPPLLVNKVLLVHSHTYLFRNHPGLLSCVTAAELSGCDRDRTVLQARHMKPSDPLQKKPVDSCSGRLLWGTNEMADLEMLCKLQYLYEMYIFILLLPFRCLWAISVPFTP